LWKMKVLLPETVVSCGRIDILIRPAIGHAWLRRQSIGHTANRCA